MSERGYLRNRALNKTGPNTSTCFPQAFDRITPEASISSYTYDQYRAVMRLWEKYPNCNSTNRHNAIYRDLVGLIASDLGGYDFNDVVFEYAHKARRLSRILDHLFDHAMRPVIDLMHRNGEIHSVGVQQIDNGLYWLVGYGIPAPIRNTPVEASQIEHFLADTGYLEKPFWPFQGRNISALPMPEVGTVSIKTEKGHM